MRVACVTGTNGKTTTTSMVAAIAAAAGLTPARITTVGSWVGDEPIATDVSMAAYEATLRRASELGASAFAIEVTSQALAAGFAPPWPVNVAVFTNLTHDHLDYHGTMEAYLAAKARLFVGLPASASAVFNASDEASALLDEVAPKGVRRLWYAARPVDPACAGAKLDLRAAALHTHRAGTHIELEPSPLAEALGGSLDTPLVGPPFAENALAAACAGVALGFDPGAIRRGLASMAKVAGRFEIVVRRPLLVVDYAHTPDALGHALRTARALVAGEGGRVGCVFGCGGGRDAEKRPIMGRVAAELADLVVITTDNPRHEDPAAIAAAVESGVSGGRAEVRRELDRARAIEKAVAWASPCDAVVIAGKGHERQQDLGERALPFDDGEVALRAHRALSLALRKATLMRLNREKFLVALIAFEAAGASACSKDSDASKDQTRVLGAQPAANPLIEGGFVPPTREGGIPPVREVGVPPLREGGGGRVTPVAEGAPPGFVPPSIETLPPLPVPPGFEGRLPPVPGGVVVPGLPAPPATPTPTPTVKPPVAPPLPPGQRRLPMPGKR